MLHCIDQIRPSQEGRMYFNNAKIEAIGPRPARQRHKRFQQRIEREQGSKRRSRRNRCSRRASPALLVRLARRRARTRVHQCGQRLIQLMGTSYGATAIAEVARGVRSTHAADLRRVRAAFSKAGLSHDPGLGAMCVLWLMGEVFGRLMEREAIALTDTDDRKLAPAVTTQPAPAPAAVSSAAWQSRRRRARRQRRQQWRARKALQDAAVL